MSNVDEALRRAAQATDRAALWSALEPVRDRLGADERVARLWCEALMATPARRSLIAEARVVLDRWPEEPGLAGAACSALLRAAERRPIDEPPLGDDPALLAQAGAARCFDALDPQAARDPEIGGRLLALRGNALRLLGADRSAEAAPLIERAIALDPGRAEWWLDLALAHKWRREFDRAEVACKRARELGGEGKAILWNLAIAATACADAKTACDAWRALGIDASLARGSLPFVEGLANVRVRLPTRGSGHALDAFVPDEAAGFEIVWAQPLSPCHGVVRTPTLRDARADIGDVVLWDGAPIGPPQGEAPCFPLLAVLSRGDERRFRFLALQQKAGEIDAIARALEPDAILYSHGERVELACPRCAAGERMLKHEHLPPEEHRIVAGKLIADGATDLGALEDRLRRAREAVPGVLLAVPELYEALQRTAEAGKHHQRWGAIERMTVRNTD